MVTIKSNLNSLKIQRHLTEFVNALITCVGLMEGIEKVNKSKVNKLIRSLGHYEERSDEVIRNTFTSGLPRKTGFTYNDRKHFTPGLPRAKALAMTNLLNTWSLEKVNKSKVNKLIGSLGHYEERSDEVIQNTFTSVLPRANAPAMTNFLFTLSLEKVNKSKVNKLIGSLGHYEERSDEVIRNTFTPGLPRAKALAMTNFLFTYSLEERGVV